MITLAIVVGPWGDYPLNDDWQYARPLKTLAETGRLHIDVPVAPSLVGQIVYTQALIINLTQPWSGPLPPDSHLTSYTADVILK